MKHALVTGGAQRIGKEIALHLARHGWDITIHYHSSKIEAQALADEIMGLGKGRQAWVVQADLENEAEVKTLFDKLSKPATALVCNASLFLPDEYDSDGARHYQVNCLAPRMLMAQLKAQLPDSEYGAVVYLLDNTPLNDNFKSYAKSRAGLVASIRQDAFKNAKQLSINGLALGAVLQGKRESDAHFQGLVQKAPNGQTKMEDVTEEALRLISSRSTVGEVRNVDGGFHLLSQKTNHNDF